MVYDKLTSQGLPVVIDDNTFTAKKSFLVCHNIWWEDHRWDIIYFEFYEGKLWQVLFCLDLRIAKDPAFYHTSVSGYFFLKYQKNMKSDYNDDNLVVSDGKTKLEVHSYNDKNYYLYLSLTNIEMEKHSRE